MSAREPRRRTVLPRVARRAAVSPRAATLRGGIDRRHAGEPVEILDSVSGPFERELDTAPRHAQRRR